MHKNITLDVIVQNFQRLIKILSVWCFFEITYAFKIVTNGECTTCVILCGDNPTHVKVTQYRRNCTNRIEPVSSVLLVC